MPGVEFPQGIEPDFEQGVAIEQQERRVVFDLLGCQQQSAAGAERRALDGVVDPRIAITAAEMRHDDFGTVPDRKNEARDALPEPVIELVFEERPARHRRHRLGKVWHGTAQACAQPSR